jgi:hypothetical protein
MPGQTVILRSPSQRALAHKFIEQAPDDAVVNVREATRGPSQNDKMWAMLSDISRAKPAERRHTPEVWKCLMMKACGHAVQFEMGIDGEPFPVGFRTSRLTKSQMSELIEFMYAYGAEHSVQWSEPNPYETAA